MPATKPFTKHPLRIDAMNREVGFFPSESAFITMTYTSGKVIHPFMWIQGFFSATDLVPAPLIAVWDGQSVDASGNLIVNPVQFPFSGALQPVRGTCVITNPDTPCVDYLGNSFSVTPISSDATAGFTYLIVGGGERP